jgi:hypothetical protein
MTGMNTGIQCLTVFSTLANVYIFLVAGSENPGLEPSIEGLSCALLFSCY